MHAWADRKKTVEVGDENANDMESFAQGLVRQSMPWGRFLPVDFGSGFGTMLQGVPGFLAPREGPNVALPKGHITIVLDMAPASLMSLQVGDPLTFTLPEPPR